MSGTENYLKEELYDLVQKDTSLFEFFQQGSLDGVWYWDLEREDNEWMSPRFWELFGYDPSEKKHSPQEWQDMIYPEDLEVALNNLKRHCEDPNHPYDQTVRYRHKDGSTIWVRCRGIAIRDETGKPIRMLGAHTDVTELKRTVEELRQKTIELDRIKIELTEALQTVDMLESTLHICCYCKRVLAANGTWQPLDTFLRKQPKPRFSDCICPDCMPQAKKDLGVDSYSSE